MSVRVPASSANLGPGFDTLGMALGLHLECDWAPLANGKVVDDGHPALKAFRLAHGEGDLWVRCPIPMGRGLGFSGAARVAGLVAAHAQRAGDCFDLGAVADEVLQISTRLEGHADNVAASLHGGVVATAGGKAVRVPVALDPTVLVWVPSWTTSTDHSRATLAATIPFADAVFNVGRTALLVAALAAGDVGALRTATQDRLHQDVRFGLAQPSRDALTAALEGGAWCGWLSGSGPSVAVLCGTDEVDAVAAAFPTDGSVKRLAIDQAGATVD